jgi:hypothetical protein
MNWSYIWALAAAMHVAAGVVLSVDRNVQDLHVRRCSWCDHHRLLVD